MKREGALRGPGLLVASAIAHLAIFAWLARTPERAPRSPEWAPPPAATIGVEVEVDPVELPPPPATSEPSPAASPERLASVARRSASGGAAGAGAPSPAASAAPASSAAGAEAIAGGNTDWIVNLGPNVRAHDFHGTTGPGRSRQEAEAETRAATGPRKDQSLKGALLAEDAAKGLGPDGPVLRALEEETRTSLAPVRGNATFRAVVDATGAVTGLSLLDSTGDRAGWDDARARALAALQKKKLEMHGTNGALIDIRVESELRYPSGAVSRADVGVKDGRLTLSGDLSDIGSRPSRVVHARLSNYTPL